MGAWDVGVFDNDTAGDWGIWIGRIYRNIGD